MWITFRSYSRREKVKILILLFFTDGSVDIEFVANLWSSCVCNKTIWKTKSKWRSAFPVKHRTRNSVMPFSVQYLLSTKIFKTSSSCQELWPASSPKDERRRIIPLPGEGGKHVTWMYLLITTLSLEKIIKKWKPYRMYLLFVTVTQFGALLFTTPQIILVYRP